MPNKKISMDGSYQQVTSTLENSPYSEEYRKRVAYLSALNHYKTKTLEKYLESKQLSEQQRILAQKLLKAYQADKSEQPAINYVIDDLIKQKISQYSANATGLTSSRLPSNMAELISSNLHKLNDLLEKNFQLDRELERLQQTTIIKLPENLPLFTAKVSYKETEEQAEQLDEEQAGNSNRPYRVYRSVESEAAVTVRLSFHELLLARQEIKEQGQLKQPDPNDTASIRAYTTTVNNSITAKVLSSERNKNVQEIEKLSESLTVDASAVVADTRQDCAAEADQTANFESTAARVSAR